VRKVYAPVRADWSVMASGRGIHDRSRASFIVCGAVDTAVRRYLPEAFACEEVKNRIMTALKRGFSPKEV